MRFILLTALYLLGAWYAEAFIRAPGQVALFWPASGLAYAAVIRYGPRWALFIPAPVLLMHWMTSPVPVSFLPYSVLSNLLGVLAGIGVVRLTTTRTRISVASGFGLLRGAMVMVAVSGLIGTTGLVTSGMITSDAFWPALAKWSMGDLLGIACVAPSFLILTAPPSTNPDLPPWQDYSGGREKSLWAAGMLLSFAVVYLGGNRNNLYALGMVALPLSLLLWSAIRFQPVWTVLGTSAVTVFLTSLTGLGLAGFTPPEKPLDSALLLGFMCLFSLIPLVLVASIFEQRLATRKVLRRAMTDAPTGLPNRAAFEEATQQALERKGGVCALAYLDLDHFTLINDTASHAAGDALIHGIGSLLKARVRNSDRVFRIGGDEFALLLDGEGAGFQERMQDLLRALENYRVGWRDHVLNITGSIGLVIFEPGQLEFARLLSLADAACFTAKELGGNRVCLASREPGEMQERTEAMRWAVRIREALDRGLFELDCQAITSLHDQPTEGRHFEVLLRMRDPMTGQRLEPGHFIPAAERFQLGVALDRHVVELTLRWLEARPDAAAQVHSCAINLTAASLVDEGFRQFLFDRVRNSKIPANKLCFEITETSAVRDLARAQGLITQMRTLGCAFSLDDFGTGFCSFNYLRSLDVDYFKIDGSFVRDLDSSSLSTAVIRAITDIAHVLDKQTIAEHTENEAVCSVLRELGVDFAQGYGIHKPQPIEQYFALASSRPAFR
ncbi:bifunctional diguanylate cyclase/phosphodiesterase [Arenimonas oryziterrae]|uniref:bifunctional diguanylate cyclase/phosphodiesterase n=1 Tax=Arenimonas oryziterrae TaxID=498055 RepID=UPI0012DF1FDD|nr:EAL domain-containing protein [Arenimonas oryziterrae]